MRRSLAKQTSLVVAQLLLFLLILMSRSCVGQGGGARRDREWKLRKNQCEEDRSLCGGLIPEEAYNCINNCTSPSCFDKVYAAQPLEDGEVDMERSRAFIACVREENKYNKKQRRTIGI